MTERIHVVAGVLRDGDRVLLAQRPAGKDLAGLWEFPGGKCERGEPPVEALRRELREELGIVVGACERLIGVPWRYAQKSILLDVYEVAGYRGEPHGREGQALRWATVHELVDLPMPPADRPVVTALRLPPIYAISPEPDEPQHFLTGLRGALAAGIRLVQLRSKTLDSQRLRDLAIAARAQTAAAGAYLMLNDSPELAVELALDGVHLSAARLMRSTVRPLASNQWVAASCHDARELAQAARIGVDFAVVGPVHRTMSHPGAWPLGWQRFAQLCAQAPFPVFALGGLCRDDLADARAAGAHGVAGISAFWPSD